MNKKSNTEIYREILKEFIKILETNMLLTEKILINYHENIYRGFAEEREITIENLKINFSYIFKQIKSKLIEEKPKLKGSFF